MKDAKSEFWDAMEDISEGMLGLEGEFLIPMTPKVRDDVKDGTIWFITAEGTDLQKAVAAGPKAARLVVSDRGEGLWADIKGTLAQITSQDVVDDVWSAMTGAWFEDGKRDDDVRLMSFTPSEAEATISDDNALEFFYKIAKAKITGDTPDNVGWQGKITF
ncbi:pyridoxamine 5'-phosphate oxidase family protein [Thalassorhabdomicrobium marinisediminis]|nr:pyridoxamine 5'-phosphate oxidase family protein [Thalassorhabdomicrobium marinisediminis]